MNGYICRTLLETVVGVIMLSREWRVPAIVCLGGVYCLVLPRSNNEVEVLTVQITKMVKFSF